MWCKESWFCILLIDLLAFYLGSLALVSVVKGILHNVWFLLQWAWNTSLGCCSLSLGKDCKELQALAEELQSIWFQGLSACTEKDSVQQQCKQGVLEIWICCAFSSGGGWLLRSCWVDNKGFPTYCCLCSFIYLIFLTVMNFGNSQWGKLTGQRIGFCAWWGLNPA